eukprot:7208399-Prymnesium_polylepis.1
MCSYLRLYISRTASQFQLLQSVSPESRSDVHTTVKQARVRPPRQSGSGWTWSSNQRECGTSVQQRPPRCVGPHPGASR